MAETKDLWLAKAWRISCGMSHSASLKRSCMGRSVSVATSAVQMGRTPAGRASGGGKTLQWPTEPVWQTVSHESDEEPETVLDAVAQRNGGDTLRREAAGTPLLAQGVLSGPPREGRRATAGAFEARVSATSASAASATILAARRPAASAHRCAMAACCNAPRPSGFVCGGGRRAPTPRAEGGATRGPRAVEPALGAVLLHVFFGLWAWTGMTHRCTAPVAEVKVLNTVSARCKHSPSPVCPVASRPPASRHNSEMEAPSWHRATAPRPSRVAICARSFWGTLATPRA
mmetsp:Transcript_58908/g.164579  ORF Transcript_58908/g.164579 Transcript_58908/m.164579 type:complete len:288 (-) Transcript_58908:294-1157(-)